MHTRKICSCSMSYNTWSRDVNAPRILHARVWYITDIVSRIYRKAAETVKIRTDYVTHWIRSDTVAQSIFTNAERKKIRTLRDFDRIIKFKNNRKEISLWALKRSIFTEKIIHLETRRAKRSERWLIRN